MNEKILFVDDDSNLLASMERNLRRQFRLETAVSAEAGLKKIDESGPFAAVFSDRQMPGMDGTQFLAEVCRKNPDTVRVLLTGNVNLHQAVSAVNLGNIFRILIKPYPVEMVAKVAEDSIKQYRLVVAEKELLAKTLCGSIKLLSDILSMVDANSFGRAEKLRNLTAKMLAKVPLADSWETQMAAMLASIGSVTLPPEILLKHKAGEPLSKNEEQLFETIPGITARLLCNIPRLEGVARIARYQGKRFDGAGYPNDGTLGEQIPAASRLLKILNDFLDMQAAGLTQLQALDEMILREGWYDPDLLNAVRSYFGLLQNEHNECEKKISIHAVDLAIGMTLASDVETKDGTLILSKGHYITEMILERIGNFNKLYGIKEPIFVQTP